MNLHIVESRMHHDGVKAEPLEFLRAIGVEHKETKKCPVCGMTVLHDVEESTLPVPLPHWLIEFN